VAQQLDLKDIRVSVDDRNEKIGRKIRDNELKRIPYLLIVGEKEMEAGVVAVRKQGEGDQGAKTVDAFAADINAEVEKMMKVF
jgi:threonyl-tRNA synthetase